MKYTNIDRIVSKLQRDNNLQDIHIADIIEWTGEALEFINATRAKEEAVAFINVKNYQCELPYNLHNIIQVAKNTTIDDPTTYETVTSEDDEQLEPETDYPVCLDCNGMPYNDYDVAYYRPYTDLKYEYELWRNIPTYNRCYVPVRLTNHSFFNSIVCSEDGQDCGISSGNPNVTSNDIYHTGKYEYTIIEGSVLRFNFEKGLIALAYLRNVTDKDGLPMIPDNISFVTAVIAYIRLKLTEREFYSNKEGSSQKLQYAQQQWQWYAKQASNKSLIPQGIDELENIKDQRNYIIPRRNVYDNYFGNLNNKEVKNIFYNRGTLNYNYYGRRT